MDISAGDCGGGQRGDCGGVLPAGGGGDVPAGGVEPGGGADDGGAADCGDGVYNSGGVFLLTPLPLLDSLTAVREEKAGGAVVGKVMWGRVAALRVEVRG